MHRQEVSEITAMSADVHVHCMYMYIRMKANLEYCTEMIPTLSTQLRIIASVKASTPDDASVSPSACGSDTDPRATMLEH